MKRIGGVLLSLTAAWLLIGCGSDNGDDDGEALKSVSIFYNDGTIFGKTCSQMFESGFNVCDIADGEVIGFMRFDGLVYDTGGRQIGQCQGNYDIKSLIDPDQSLDGDCVFPFARGENGGDWIGTEGASGVGGTDLGSSADAMPTESADVGGDLPAADTETAGGATTESSASDFGAGAVMGSVTGTGW